MTGTTVNLTAIPTGGAVTLQMPAYDVPPNMVSGAMTISRAVSGVSGIGAFTQLYSGAPTSFYVDVGEMSAGPLNAASGYVYQVVDPTGTTQVGPAYPAQSLEVKPDGMTNMFMCLLRCGVNNLVYPSGYNRPTVSTDMPVRGFPTLPFMTVNLEMLEQSDTGIGRDTIAPVSGNLWVMPLLAKWTWRVTVLSNNARERDFLRDSVCILYNALHPYVFAQLGMNMEHGFMANSYQISEEKMQMSPGFYGADILCKLRGNFNTTILTNLGYIDEIVMTATGADGVATVAEVPVTL